MTYSVKRWDSWSSCQGREGLDGLEALLNEERSAGRRLCQLVVHSEDIYIAVFDDEPPSPS